MDSHRYLSDAPLSELWDIVIGAVMVDTDETVVRAANILRARGEFSGLGTKL